MKGRFRIAVALATTLLVASAMAQQAGKVYRLGMLHPAAPPSGADLIEVLREFGYAEGQNLAVERRYAEGRPDRLPGLARELVQLRVDVIVGPGAAIEAARHATQTIPIVMNFATDPVGRGFVASLARPGGNISGVTYAEGPEIAGKRLQLIKEAVPRAARIAVLYASDVGPLREATQKAASSLGVRLIAVDVQDANYDRAFTSMVAERAGALVVSGSPILNAARKNIIALAARHRLPAIYEWREHVEEGGLMAYGASQRALLRRVASFVDRIFKGAHPAELPVEQPTVFELAVNLKTATALGLILPQSVLVRADRVVQ